MVWLEVVNRKHTLSTTHHITLFFYVSLLLLLDATKAGFGQRKLCAKKASCMVGTLKTTALGIGPLRC